MHSSTHCTTANCKLWGLLKNSSKLNNFQFTFQVWKKHRIRLNFTFHFSNFENKFLQGTVTVHNAPCSSCSTIELTSTFLLSVVGGCASKRGWGWDNAVQCAMCNVQCNVHQRRGVGWDSVGQSRAGLLGGKVGSPSCQWTERAESQCSPAYSYYYNLSALTICSYSE